MREFSSVSSSEIAKPTALDTRTFNPDKRIDANRQFDRNLSAGYNVDKRLNFSNERFQSSKPDWAKSNNAIKNELQSPQKDSSEKQEGNKTSFSVDNHNLDRSNKNEVDYSRPTGFREGVRDKVWENAKDSHGRVRDPLTGRYMSKDKPWDMGHQPGYEFKKHQESARERGISREQFLNEHNNPDHYRPELPSSNRSHKGEDKTGQYFGD